MPDMARKVGYAMGRADRDNPAKIHEPQAERFPVSHSVVDESVSTVKRGQTEKPARPPQAVSAGGTAAHTSRGLWAYAATGGSLAVLIGGLVSLLIPRPWGVPSWVGVTLLLAVGVGLAADKFFD